MQKLFVCVLILGSITVTAQEQKEVQVIPELQEWYTWKGDVNTGATVSYLPGFDSLGGGLNAITQGRTGDRVWYNRFPLDTAEQFRWKNQGSYAVVQIDFNNDGIHDYIDAKGRIYAGIKKGAKPNPEPVRSFSRGNINNPFVGDMNGDGFRDILMWNSMTDCEIDFGAKEWSSMKRSIISFPLSGKYSSYIGGYINEANKPRIIVYVLRDYFEGFYLYGIRTEDKGDSVHVFLDELDKIEESYLNQDHKSKYWYSLTMVYQETTKSTPFINIYEAPKEDNKPPISKGFTISNDKFLSIRDDAPGGGEGSDLGGSIDGDNIPDIFEVDKAIIGGQEKIVYNFYSGNPQFSDGVPKMYFLYNTECPFLGKVRYIGDVNGDNIGDFSYSCGEEFRIILGLNWRTVGINPDSPSTQFTLYQNEPNPVQKDRNTLLPVSLQKEGIYSLFLYNIQGIIVKKLFEGLLPYGEIKIPLDLKGIPSGMYIVKMSNGTSTRERAIIISE